MRIVDILTSEESVVTDLHGKTKDEVLRELAGCLAAQHPAIDARRLLEVLWERERLGSTAIGDGIAIPHGKLPGLGGVIGCLALHRQGVNFDSLDGGPTRIFVLLVAPEESVGLHLKALARVSRILKERAFRERLMSAPGRAELYSLICQEDERL